MLNYQTKANLMLLCCSLSVSCPSLQFQITTNKMQHFLIYLFLHTLQNVFHLIHNSASTSIG